MTKSPDARTQNGSGLVKSDYLPLRVSSLKSASGFHTPSVTTRTQVNLASPAIEIMTDLQKVKAVEIKPDATIDAASHRMVARAVRLLLVIDDPDNVLGLITATDVLGEKPMQFLQKYGGARRDILVRDLMTPWDRLEVIEFEDVLHAKVGHVIATLKTSGRQHALVVDGTGKQQKVRGLFSTSQVAKQIGAPIQATEIARTFAEIEATLSR